MKPSVRKLLVVPPTGTGGCGWQCKAVAKPHSNWRGSKQGLMGVQHGDAIPALVKHAIRATKQGGGRRERGGKVMSVESLQRSSKGRESSTGDQ